MTESLNLSFIQELKEADPELLPTLYRMFSVSSREKMGEIRRAIESKDWTALRKTSHALRSSSLNLGGLALPEVLQRIELFQEGDEHSLETEIRLAEQEWEKMLQELEKIIG